MSDNYRYRLKRELSKKQQYWKNEWLDDTLIISYFGGSNNIFADCIYENYSGGVCGGEGEKERKGSSRWDLKFNAMNG